MSYYTHIIDPEHDKSLLEQHRKDPITGEELQAYQEVVFCSECKSAFLRESWEYIGSKHCNQYNTLSEVPLPKSLKLQLPFKIGEIIEYFKSPISKDKRIGSIMVDLLLMGVMSAIHSYGGYFFFLLKDALIKPGISPGKWLFGLRLLNSKTKRPPSLIQLLLRSLPFFVMCLLPVWSESSLIFFFIGIFVEYAGIFMYKTKVGDIIARTQIVSETEYQAYIEAESERSGTLLPLNERLRLL